MDGTVMATHSTAELNIVEQQFSSVSTAIKLTYHPVANLFPLIEGDDFNNLVADIKENGLREPIMTTRDDCIVDGRNRYRACLAAAVEPKIEVLEIDEDALLAWVLSRNLHRRHLTTPQRAAVAADIANLKQGGSGQPANLPVGVSPADAAAMLNVSERSVRSATLVKETSLELHEAVKEGKLSTHAAEQIANLPEEERTELIEQVKAGDRKGAKNNLKSKKKSKVKIQATARKSQPKTTHETRTIGIPAAYGALLEDLHEVPLLLKSYPLMREHVGVLVTALRTTLELVASVTPSEPLAA